MYVLLYVSYLYICNVIGANKNKFKKNQYDMERKTSDFVRLNDVKMTSHVMTNRPVSIK